MTFFRSLFFGLTALLLSTTAQAETATVAVAANFAQPLSTLSAAFTKSSGHTLVAVLGATQKLIAQIENGAPFDVLLSADDSSSHRLDAKGLALAAPQFIYATGALVLWSADPKTVDSEGRVLETSPAEHLAMADPAVAPYGVAAMEVLTHLGLTPRWQKKCVLGNNIGQAYQFVASGNVELGFVAASEVIQEGKLVRGSLWVVPQKLYTPLRQEARLLLHGDKNVAARAFLDYLRTEPAERIMQAYGYKTLRE